MERKYELTNEFILHNGRPIFRIKALRTFGDVVAGEFGGFIENEGNLSHEGDCWVNDNAKVYGHARVLNDSLLFDNAEVFDNAIIKDNVYLFDNTKVYGNAVLETAADTYGNTEIFGDSIVGDGATIKDGYIRESDDYHVVTDKNMDTFITFFKVKDGNISMIDSVRESNPDISITDYVDTLKKCFADLTEAE